ncbi:MAG: hypothetical protein HOC23_23415 [Halieaceae bacterium]|jgi:hypothetical protein|nr:hypothetical protein [Halieaceae bacterium]
MSHSFISYSVLRRWLWRWHRRAGLIAAVVLSLVTVTGVFLNHTAELSLGKKYVGQAWLLGFYGIPEPKLVSFNLGETTVTGDDKGQLYWGTEPLEKCRGGLVGAAVYEAGFIASCAAELFFFDSSGRLVEKVSAVYGLPTPITQLGQCDERLCIRTPKRLFELDLEVLSFKPLVGVKAVWSKPVPLAERISQAIYADSRRQGLSWERVLLDLHSGRLFGSPGVWVVDLAAILLFFLSVSGFVLWYQHMRAKRTRRNTTDNEFQ